MNQREQAQKLFEQGHTPAAIEELTNGEIPANKVRAWKSRYKWAGSKSNKSVAQHKPQQKAQRNTATASIDKQLVEAVEKNTELTDAQKAFCLHYSKTFNATASYQRAYPNCSYETAGSNGWALLQKAVIRAEVLRLKQIRNLHLMASGDDVVEKYMHIAFADISDYLEWGRVEVDIMGMYGPVMIPDPENPEGEKIPLTKKVNEVRFRESNMVDGSLLAEVKQGKDGASIKLADRMKALDWLARYFEINPLDKHKVAYDNAKLDIERQTLKLQEDKAHGITDGAGDSIVFVDSEDEMQKYLEECGDAHGS